MPRSGKARWLSHNPSRTRSPLTITQEGWRPTSCPKLPQWHPSVGIGSGIQGAGAEHHGVQFLSHLHALGGGVVGYLIPFLFVLSIVVFFHELGHFLVARWCGVRVLVFSIGFGPEIVGFNDRHGTRWKISAIPLGGFVKFFGDENAASAPDGAQLADMDADERARSFIFQPVRKRAAIVVAGPLANFILAIVIFAAIFMLYGKQTMSARVDTVQPDSAAAAAGFQPGDLVVAIDGATIDNFADMQRIVSESAGETLAITVERNGVQRVLKADARAQGRQGHFRQCPPHRNSRHQPVDGAGGSEICSRCLRRRRSGWACRRPGLSSTAR